MLITSLADIDGSHCLLTLEEADGWLRATWCGHMDHIEALRGARSYLAQATVRPCVYLLNDNLALRGPWFDSVAWLERAWLPHARRLGLRYVAHVVQADTHTDIPTLTFPKPVRGELEFQIFSVVAKAEKWLGRSCQQRPSHLRRAYGSSAV